MGLLPSLCSSLWPLQTNSIEGMFWAAFLQVGQIRFHHALTVSSLGSDCQAGTAPLLQFLASGWYTLTDTHCLALSPFCWVHQRPSSNPSAI